MPSSERSATRPLCNDSIGAHARVLAMALAVALAGCGAPPFSPGADDLTCNSAQQCRVEVNH